MVIIKDNTLFNKLGSLVQDSYVGYEDKIESLIAMKYSMSSFTQSIMTDDSSLNIEEIESECEKYYSRVATVSIKKEPDHGAIMHRGPWNQINNTLRSEIEQVSETAINYEKANQELKEQVGYKFFFLICLGEKNLASSK